ncbi:MAG: NAAT family transporter [Hydromonas sp.]|nr:NAAT family transporter [Hydromonas sp.]MBP6295401.1 NAAT family transporter [Hydromonas sp.]
MDAFKIFIALIALVNPLGVLPMFISLTQDFTPAQKQRAIRTAAFTVVAVISTCALLGEQIIKFFGISTASLQVAGGLLILLMSLSMLNAQPSGAKTTAEERDEAEHKDTIGVVPLGIPLLTGPGAMSTVIVLAGKSNHVSDYIALIGSGVVIAALVWLTLQMAQPIARFMGRTGINIATRIMGLLVAAVAVEFIVEGLKTMLPALAG